MSRVAFVVVLLFGLLIAGNACAGEPLVVEPAELHIYATGDHDFGVRQNDKLPASWTGLCVKWLTSQGLLKASPAE